MSIIWFLIGICLPPEDLQYSIAIDTSFSSLWIVTTSISPCFCFLITLSKSQSCIYGLILDIALPTSQTRVTPLFLSIVEYKKIFTIGFFFKGFKYLGELIKDNETGERIWFIKPYVKDFKEKTVIISDVISQSPYWKCDIYNTNFKNQKLNEILKTFREDSIFYSDDLTGTEFKKAINFIIRR